METKETAKYIYAARARYASDDLEIDVTPAVARAYGGAWVAAWVLVSDDDVTDSENDERAP